ncbi:MULTISPECIES: hypothetical protein [unclassified Saccharicrinis]|uniref:hypothetical protein n=1 Tax=unclassified Saccharicrinis TaxID=2646859 RepID=UPI0035DAB103
MRFEKMDDLEVFQIGVEIEKIGNEAIKTVKKENRKMGIPLVFSRNGEIYYELPDGSVTKESPFRKN